MKYFFIVPFFIGYFPCILAQNLSRHVTSRINKPPLDTSVLDKWPYVANPGISNDGNYAAYTIEKQPLESRTFVVKSTNSSWKKEFTGASEYLFTGDNRQVVFKTGDTVSFLLLGSDKRNYVTNVHSCKWPEQGKGEWLAYQLNNPSRELVLLNLLSGKEQRFAFVTDYSFNENEHVLLIKTEFVQDSVPELTLKWMSLEEGKVTTIWSTQGFSPNVPSIGSYNFDANGTQLAFVVKERKSTNWVNTIWYYKGGMDKAIMLVKDRSPGIDSDLIVSGGFPQFSKNGRWIFFELQKPTNTNLKPDIVKVNVWSYKDAILQPEQLRILRSGPQSVAAIVSVSNGQVICVQREDERIVTTPQQVTGDFIVILNNYIFENSGFLPWWNLSPQPSYYLVSLKDGSRKLLKKENFKLMGFSFSPAGRYLVYYDYSPGQNSYFSYDLKTGKLHNISQATHADFSREYVNSIYHLPVAEVAGWHEQDSTLLMYDNYDIWQMDPSGINKPVNITNGYGLANHIKFRLVYGPKESWGGNPIIFKGNDSILLTAFSSSNKYNGFYRKILGKKGNPKLLTMGPYTWYHAGSQIGGFYEFDDRLQPLKAKDKNIWIVRRESAEEAPNYFITNDFKIYSALSNLQPQISFNWLKTELVNWRQLDGTQSQGILYKPENFDAHKKYPVIFNYYEYLSHRLYEYPKPEFTGDNINIPWFVSNGYLVFTPDIHYAVANTSNKVVGEWAYNSVVSAANYLAKLPYVDANKMAIQGHSFGGLETNYLLTHTHLFAAAAEVAGSSDPISAYLTLLPFLDSVEHYSKQVVIEMDHELYGGTPWQRPDLYRKSSAVLNANQVTTPLLIMHNVWDNNVQWRQGVELYMALRRLCKKVWMLQYDNGDHSVFGKDAVDYTIRLTQFFDYFLKGFSPPKWMTDGVPASRKGIDTGLELDYSGKKP